MVPDTSTYWSFHQDLLDFCPKFRLAPACDHLNHYHNITSDYWAIPEKIQAGGLRTYFFEKKTPELL